MPKQCAFVFPGQGSQTLGMLSDIAAQFVEVQQTFDQASAVLDYDLWQLVQVGPQEKLDQTQYTQPALLTASYAIWRMINSKISLQPQMLAGHSLGEYTALLCANAFSFEDAIRLVASRGQYMQEAVKAGEGAMAAIVGLENTTVIELCQKISSSTSQVLAPANFNSIGQIVIAGHKEAVERAIIQAKELGAKLATLIPVSVPSHSPLMKEAAKRLAELLAKIPIQPPQFPVLNNVDVKLYHDAQSIRDGLTRQLYQPVRWVETIQYFSAHGITTIVECGPGKILTGLNKRIDKNLNLFPTFDMAHLQVALEFWIPRTSGGTTA